MDFIKERYYDKVKHIDLRFIRSAMQYLKTNDRLIGLKGPRGIGKTTLLLQYVKQQKNWRSKVLYASLDNLWFSNHSLYDLVDDFVKQGGEQLLLDEVHTYEGWSRELKNIFDDWPQLKIIFSGSSLLEISDARADLSRRAVVYHLQGLSFREFLHLKEDVEIKAYTLSEIMTDHLFIANQIVEKIKPIAYFSDYLKYGYFPFFVESRNTYHQKLEEVIRLVLEMELPALRNIEITYVHKLKQVLAILAESVPFVPNMSKLSERIGINRTTLLQYVYYLREAGLIQSIYKESKGISRLQKPEKILLDNPNFAYTLSREVEIGSLREAFFVNQVGYDHALRHADKGDFIVEDRWSFEIGGKNKNFHQIKGLENAFLALDDIEMGSDRKIPLWLFGFLY
jgi:hypothetical protein